MLGDTEKRPRNCPHSDIRTGAEAIVALSLLCRGSGRHDGRFINTDVSRYLRSDVNPSLRE